MKSEKAPIQKFNVKCNDCGGEFITNHAERRRLKKGLYELGVTCQICDNWLHAYFITDEIINLPRDTRKEKRHYVSQLKKLNKRERWKRHIRKVNGVWVQYDQCPAG